MIRHATSKDYSEISDVRKQYLLDVDRLQEAAYRWQMQRSGFIGSFTEIEFKEDLHHLFLVDEDKSGILGYLRIDNDREYKDNDKKIWFSDELKQAYFSDPYAEVGMIGVSERARRIGVATGLFDYALQQLQKKDISYLFSIVVFSPITNFPSMMLHEKLGFVRVAISMPHFHFDMHSYQSILYAKAL